MSIEKAAAETRAGQAKITEGLATLNQVAVLFDQARTLLAQATQGTQRPEAGQALSMLAQALEVLVAQYQTAQAASDAVETFLVAIAAPTGAPATTGPVATPSSARQEPRAVPQERIDQLRRELPPDITPSSERRPGTPQPKTHGRWIGPDGEVNEEVSGWDDKYRAAVEWFKAQPNSRRPATASDVEVKLAVHMRQNNVKDVTLAINHVPCEGELGCDTLVPQILPEGYTLTVHGARGFKKVYYGRAK